MIICFHHSDLDGMGVKLLTLLYAQERGIECETYKCDYTYVDDVLETVHKNHQYEDIDEIIMADISPAGKGIECLNDWYEHKIPVRLRDHHKTAEHLNSYPWAMVMERFEGVERCGTWLLSHDTGFRDIINREFVDVFVQAVDSWDTWKWKKTNDIAAKNLNGIFQILGEEDFTKYMLDVFGDIDLISNDLNITADMLFNPYGKALIEAHERQVRKAANKCIKDMWVMDLKIPRKSNPYKTAIVFASQDLSDIGDIILTQFPEIDIVMLVSFPKTISYRTQKRLDIPLGDIAKYMTGSGGEHPQAAGSTISEKQFNKFFRKTMENLSCNTKGIEFINLKTFDKE